MPYARPKLIEFDSEFFADPEIPTEPANTSFEIEMQDAEASFSVSESVTTEAGVQVDFISQELAELKKKYAYLEREYKKLRTNPPVSFIVRHLGLLRPSVTPEAFTLFECAVNNTNLLPQQKRHTVASKQLCNVLKAKSSKTFNTFREFFALPSSLTLDRYNQDYFTTTGISPEIKSALKRHARASDVEDRYIVMSFDETEIAPGFTYLPRQDSVDGFVDMGKHGRKDKYAQSVLTFAIRGLRSRWKQIFCYYFVAHRDFDADDLKSIVEECLEALFEAEFCVVATVCDGDAKNRKLFKAFQCDPETSSFQFKHHQIQFLYDVPHIMKLIRNNMMNWKIYCNFGEDLKGIIEWTDILSHLEPIVNADTIVSSCPKLTKQHLYLSSYEKMRVKLATQLFSHAVVCSFEYAIAQSDPNAEKYKIIAALFKILDRTFDILNSSSYDFRNGKPWATGLKPGNGLIPYIEMVDKLITDNNLYFLKKTSTTEKTGQVYCLDMLSTTIRGIIATAKQLFTKGFPVVFTRRFCQDILENHFAYIRSSASYLNTTLYRLRFPQSMIVYSQNHPEGANCEPDLDFPLLTDEDTISCSSESSANFRTELLEYLESFGQELSEDFEEFCTTFQDCDINEDAGCINDSAIEKISMDRGLVTYIAGYTVKRVKQTKEFCQSCLDVLAASTSLPEHLYIYIRKYHPDQKNSLVTPSQDLINTVNECLEHLEREVPNIIAIVGVKYHLFRSLCKKNFAFIPDCHKVAIINEIIRRLINMYIGKHLRDLRRDIKADRIKKIQKAKAPNLSSTAPSTSTATASESIPSRSCPCCNPNRSFSAPSTSDSVTTLSMPPPSATETP